MTSTLSIALVGTVFLFLGPAIAQTTGWPSTPAERAYSEELVRWVKTCLDKCGPDGECQRLCRNTWVHSVRCATGDRLACDDRARDLADIERYNTQFRSRSEPPARQSEDAMIQCLQRVATSVVSDCRRTGCNTNLLVDMIGEAQKVACGYSAIGSSQPPYTGFTQCTTTHLGSGSWTTMCF